MITKYINKENIFQVAIADAFTLDMAKVEGGKFIMGHNISEYDNEKPEHPVTLPDFCIGQYPITNAQFAIFLNETGLTEIVLENGKKRRFIYAHKWGVEQIDNKWRPAQGFEHHPIINVPWYGAMEYCKWLSKKTGAVYRLPTEAEWKYAASGSKGFPYAGGHKLKEVGWYRENSYRETKPVGLKLPNELGLYDKGFSYKKN